MTCHIGEGVVVCDGQGGWYVYRDLSCPWCKERRRCIGTQIFGGWCGNDYICGTCGSVWDSESETVRKLTEAQRDENIARVAAMKDPGCWDCRDTGDKEWNVPLIDPDAEPDFCACEAGSKAKAEAL